MINDALTDQAVADRAWSWIGDRLTEFDPFANGGFTIPAAQRLPELAIAILSYSRSDLRENPVAARALEWLDTARRERAFTDRAIRSPQEYSLHLDTYSLLRQLGRDDSGQRHALDVGLHSGLVRMSERPPHRLMDVALSLHWADLASGMPVMDAGMDATVMATMPDAVHLHEGALYALTHVIFFAAAFGVEPPPIPIAPSRHLERQLTFLLWRLERERHYDLLAEVLLCWDLVGYRHSPPYRRSLHVLLDQQDSAGGFPGPSTAVPDGRRPSPGEDGYFAHHYHTTLLVLLLLGQRNRRRWPITATPREIPVYGSGDAVRPLRHVLASSAQAAIDRVKSLDDRASPRRNRRGAFVAGE